MRATRIFRNTANQGIPPKPPPQTTRRFRLLRVTALGIPIVAGSLYFIDRNAVDLSLDSLLSRAFTPELPQPLDLRAANRKLRREEQTQYFRLDSQSSSSSVTLGRVDIARLSSNNPVEDEFATGGTSSWVIARYAPSVIRGLLSNTSGTSSWVSFAVYDGHAGWATSAYLRRSLIGAASTALGTAREVPGSHAEALKAAFVGVDEQIMTTALHAVMQSRVRGLVADANTIATLAPAVAGSCALLAAYEPGTARLLVGCTGDSRAVLGRRQDSLFGAAAVGYEAVPLSEDQNGSSASEFSRLNSLHPDEPDMLKGLKEKGRIFGLMVTRAFGDHRWKFQTDQLKEIHEDYFGSAPRPGAVSQPYLTAEPEVSETVIQKGEPSIDRRGGKPGDFVILASDGLWDHISSEDAVRCVREWVEARRMHPESSLRTVRLKAEKEHANSDQMGSSERLFELNEGYAEWQYKLEWLVTEDDNAATHLIRNVLGGRNRGFFCGLLSSYAPMSRNVRDDITVQVIFFGGVE